MGLVRHGSAVFRPPYLIQYEAEFEPKPTDSPDDPPRLFNLTAVMIPLKPGWSRIILFGTQSASKKADETEPYTIKKRRPPLVFKIFELLPIWMLHQFSNRFLDSDLAFLHYQEQERQRRGYFMPSQSDRCITALRNWIQTYAHIPGPLPPPITDRNVLFNRWKQHSDQCRHCNKAMRGIQKWRTNSYRVLGASILLSTKFALARVAVVVSLFLLRILATFEKSLQVGEFRHYESH